MTYAGSTTLNTRVKMKAKRVKMGEIPFDNRLRWPASASSEKPFRLSSASVPGALDLLHQSLGLIARHDRSYWSGCLPHVTDAKIGAVIAPLVAWIHPRRYSTYAERAEAGGDWSAAPGRGNRLQGETLMRRLMILLKYSQCSLSGRAKRLETLMSKYVAHCSDLYYPPGNPRQRNGDLWLTGRDVEDIRRDLPKGHSIRSASGARRIATILTSFLVGRHECERPTKSTYCALRVRWQKLDVAIAPYSNANPSIAHILHFFDLSRHDDGELGRLLPALAPWVLKTEIERLDDLQALMKDEFAEVADLLMPLSAALSMRDVMVE